MGQRPPRSSRAVWVESNPNLEISQVVILFPSSDSPCVRTESTDDKMPISHFTYHFQPSVSSRELSVTSAHFWFYAGAPNASAPLYMLTTGQRLSKLAEAPSTTSSDGWTTYHLERGHYSAVSTGPFAFQVRCAACLCRADEPDQSPFLHLLAQARVAGRALRRAPVTVPWSPLAVDLLQRPTQRRPEHSDCRRGEVSVSFDELGWGNWIVHPKALTFRYCHGSCSAPGRSAAALGIERCCAPVPKTMTSLRVTTTSDGGYSFKYETLPNLSPEECTCM